MSDFKIIKYRTGKEYPNHYNDGKPEYYIEHVKIMQELYKLEFPMIEKVIIGDNEYPVTEIHFEEGLILHDEEFSPNCQNWKLRENKERIMEWLDSRN